MRKKLLVILIVMMTLLAGCGAKDDGKIRIGVLQYEQHVALDKATEGFLACLKDNGYIDGENVTIDMQNGSGEPANCTTIADKFVNDGVDLIFANATPAAQSVANRTKDIPILITSVTNPEYSGLVDTNDKPGGNVTGTSDLTPVEAQIQLLAQILPEAKKVAIMYCGAEDNSIFQASLAKNACEKYGLECFEVTVSDTNAIQSSVESVIGKADAIYIPTDNLLAKGMTTVSMIATEHKIPVIVGETGMCENGGLCTYGVDYYNLGYQTGLMAIKVLKGEAKPAEMPIQYLDAANCSTMFNLTVAKELGITIPEELLATAETVE